ncbi:unnamed protein product [Arctia plantaginis]|uniref:Uncharacterized protein n=1 Tax=Arctia plantaginis TaxID=874455 RepID=A0A8S1BIE1_ARCPL|nr:unnamed protein product [Arctia plantaginis]
MECTGPYLYTSTECNGAFLACVLGLDKGDESRRRMCSGSPAEKGFDTVETHISWVHHPDGLLYNDEMNAPVANTTKPRLSTKETTQQIKASPTQPYKEVSNGSLANTTIPIITTKYTTLQIKSGLQWRA